MFKKLLILLLSLSFLPLNCVILSVTQLACPQQKLLTIGNLADTPLHAIELADSTLLHQLFRRLGALPEKTLVLYQRTNLQNQAPKADKTIWNMLYPQESNSVDFVESFAEKNPVYKNLTFKEHTNCLNALSELLLAAQFIGALTTVSLKSLKTNFDGLEASTALRTEFFDVEWPQIQASSVCLSSDYTLENCYTQIDTFLDYLRTKKSVLSPSSNEFNVISNYEKELETSYNLLKNILVCLTTDSQVFCTKAAFECVNSAQGFRVFNNFLMPIIVSVYATVTAADFFMTVLSQNIAVKRVVIFAGVALAAKINNQIRQLYAIEPELEHIKSEEAVTVDPVLLGNHIFTNPNLQEIFNAVIVHNYCSRCYVPTKANGAALDRCSRCKNAHYCSQECQRKNWPRHKLLCKPTVIQEKEKKADKDLRSEDAHIVETSEASVSDFEQDPHIMPDPVTGGFFILPKF